MSPELAAARARLDGIKRELLLLWHVWAEQRANRDPDEPIDLDAVRRRLRP